MFFQIILNRTKNISTAAQRSERYLHTYLKYMLVQILKIKYLRKSLVQNVQNEKCSNPRDIHNLNGLNVCYDHSSI